jgi:hypothetical protein
MTIDRAYKHCLIGKIKGLATESKHLRLAIKRTDKKLHEAKVWGLTYAKQRVGQEARHLLLAYAAIRGVPYRALEPKCRQENKPDAILLLRLIESNTPYQHQTVRKEQNGVSTWEPKWTPDTVKVWLEQPLPNPPIQAPAERPKSLIQRVIKGLGL